MWIWFKASLSKMAQLQLFPSSVRSSFSVPVFPFCVLKYYCFQIAHLPRFRACWKLHCIFSENDPPPLRTFFKKKHPNLGRRSSLRHKGKCCLLPSPFLHFSIFKKTRFCFWISFKFPFQSPSNKHKKSFLSTHADFVLLKLADHCC